MYSIKRPQTAISARLNLIAFFAILAVAIALRLIFIQGYVISDPAAYAGLANDLAHGQLHIGTYDGALIFPLRLGMYAPVALFIKMFGLSETTLMIFPFLVSLASCLLAYFLARNLFGSTAGLISLALVAILPSDIVMASTLFPDSVAAFWANLGIGLLITDHQKNKTQRSLGLSVLAGLCFGISWLSKETVVYLGPVALIYLCQRQSAMLHLACVAAAAFCVPLAEATFYRAVAGDWFFHLHTMQNNYVQNAVWFFDQSSPYFGWTDGEFTKALLRRLLISGPENLLKAFSKYPMFAMVALAWGVFAKDRRFIMLGIWLTVLMLLFNFGSSSLTTYRPLPLFFERYLYPILLPSVLLISGFLASLIEPVAIPELSAERRFWSALFAAGILAATLIAAKGLRAHPQQAVHDVVPNLLTSDTVYTDLETAQTLIFFRTRELLRSTATVVPYEHLALADLPSGSYVLINQRKIDFIVGPTGTTKYEAPEFAKTPPPTWKAKWSEEELTLFRVQ